MRNNKSSWSSWPLLDRFVLVWEVLAFGGLTCLWRDHKPYMYKPMLFAKAAFVYANEIWHHAHLFWGCYSLLAASVLKMKAFLWVENHTILCAEFLHNINQYVIWDDPKVKMSKASSVLEAYRHAPRQISQNVHSGCVTMVVSYCELCTFGSSPQAFLTTALLLLFLFLFFFGKQKCVCV